MWLILIGLYKSEFVCLYLTIRFVFVIIIAVMTYSQAESYAHRVLYHAKYIM